MLEFIRAANDTSLAPIAFLSSIWSVGTRARPAEIADAFSELVPVRSRRRDLAGSGGSYHWKFDFLNRRQFGLATLDSSFDQIN
jgi:hypothetical protein